MRKQKSSLWKSYCDQIAKERQSKSFNSLTFFTLWMQLQPLKINLLPRARHLLHTGSHITSAVKACLAASLGTFQPVSLSENNRQAGSELWCLGRHFQFLPHSVEPQEKPKPPHSQKYHMESPELCQVFQSWESLLSLLAGELGTCKMNPCSGKSKADSYLDKEVAAAFPTWVCRITFTGHFYTRTDF